MYGNYFLFWNSYRKIKVILFVGDKPSKKMKPDAQPFEGAACEKRLMEWIKFLNVDDYKFMNSYNWFMNETTYGGGFRYFNTFIALGNEASKILTKDGISHFKLPHPSGRNRQVNDKELIAKKLAECKAWLNGI